MNVAMYCSCIIPISQERISNSLKDIHEMFSSFWPSDSGRSIYAYNENYEISDSMQFLMSLYNKDNYDAYQHGISVLILLYNSWWTLRKLALLHSSISFRGFCYWQEGQSVTLCYWGRNLMTAYGHTTPICMQINPLMSAHCEIDSPLNKWAPMIMTLLS